jgi:hypothetical protein
VGGDRVGEGRARLVPRLLDEPLSLRVLVEDEVEAALEDLGGGRAGAGVRERVLRGLELLEQPAGDGDVQARELRVERLDLVARGPAEARTRTGAATSSGEVTRTRTGVATSPGEIERRADHRPFRPQPHPEEVRRFRRRLRVKRRPLRLGP